VSASSTWGAGWRASHTAAGTASTNAASSSRASDGGTGVRLDPSEAVFLEILATTGNLSLVQDDIAMQENHL